jgi:hypothetical protein
MLIPIVRVGDGAVVLSLDVTSGTFVGAQLDNSTTLAVTVEVTRPAGAAWTGPAGPGTTAKSFPKPRQVAYDDDALSDWRVSVTVGV